MDILSLPVLTPDHRIPYGQDPSQFGDLWLPRGLPRSKHSGPAPLVVFFHGGWWKSEYGLGYAGYLCRSLAEHGVAVWSAEYRRVGETGGGWPHTFQDAAAALAFVHSLAQTYALDLARVITMGHSAGGHLAFWAAGLHHVEHGGELHLPLPTVPLLGAVALAGAVDLRLTISLSGDGVFAHDRDEVYNLMGGTPEEVPGRYRQANPGDLLPFNVPQMLFQGSDDDQIPPALPDRWVAQAKHAGDHAEATTLPHADHFDVVDPRSAAWPVILAATLRLLHGRR